jgi:hypothetical protein
MTEKNWPSNLKIGTGAQGFALLNDVPIWYELWRQLNSTLRKVKALITRSLEMSAYACIEG